MRVKYILLLFVGLAIYNHSDAQEIADEAKLEKSRRQAHKLETKISANKEKLGNLEDKLKDLEANMNAEKAKAQRGADQTDKVSTKLSKDPTSKKLNRKAHKAARSSKKQARTARKHANRHDSLDKDIRKLKGRIEKSEKELSKIAL